MSKVEILPAILPKDYFELEDAIDSVRALVDEVQLDICDGVFAPSRTWPYTAGQPEEDDIFAEILAEDRGLPAWDDVDYEVHLMVNDPDRVVSDWVNAGATRILVPAERIQDMKGIVAQYQEWVEIAPSLNIETDISVIDSYANEIKSVQLMAIPKIGFHHAPFDERVLAKIQAIKEKYPHLVIAVDGAVNEETIARLALAGATRFAVGSAIFDAENYAQAIQQLKMAARG
jgi:ribulose-phosphate 3-epimerase